MLYTKNLNENLENDIDKICSKYDIKNYTINEDGTIDVDGDVKLVNVELDIIPLNFRNVFGDFVCSRNNLTSLKGSPIYVMGYFSCAYNNLTNLKYAPISIGKEIVCDHNKLSSLIGIPENCGDILYSDMNKIKNINFSHITSESMIIFGNPIDIIIKLFIYFDISNILELNSENKALLNKFNEKQIIKDDILYIDLLAEFLEDTGYLFTKDFLYNMLKYDYEIR